VAKKVAATSLSGRSPISTCPDILLRIGPTLFSILASTTRLRSGTMDFQRRHGWCRAHLRPGRMATDAAGPRSVDSSALSSVHKGRLVAGTGPPYRVRQQAPDRRSRGRAGAQPSRTPGGGMGRGRGVPDRSVSETIMGAARRDTQGAYHTVARRVEMEKATIECLRLSHRYDQVLLWWSTPLPHRQRDGASRFPAEPSPHVSWSEAWWSEFLASRRPDQHVRIGMSRLPRRAPYQTAARCLVWPPPWRHDCLMSIHLVFAAGPLRAFRLDSGLLSDIGAAPPLSVGNPLRTDTDSITRGCSRACAIRCGRMARRARVATVWWWAVAGLETSEMPRATSASWPRLSASPRKASFSNGSHRKVCRSPAGSSDSRWPRSTVARRNPMMKLMRFTTGRFEAQGW